MKKENEILERIDEIKENLKGDYTLDFLNAWEGYITDLSDNVSEFADNNTYIYYCDIDEYFENHIDESTDALKEFGYNLSDFSDLKEACRKGAQIAQYNEIYNDIMQDEDELEELKELYEELEELKSEEE